MTAVRRIGHCGCTLVRAGASWIIQHAVCEHHQSFTHAPRAQAQPVPEFLREQAPMRTMAFALAHEEELTDIEDTQPVALIDRRVRFTPEEKRTIITMARVRMREIAGLGGSGVERELNLLQTLINKLI